MFIVSKSAQSCNNNEDKRSIFLTYSDLICESNILMHDQISKKHIHIILGEISLIFYVLAFGSSSDGGKTKEKNNASNKPPVDTEGRHADTNKSELQPGRGGVFHTQGVAYSVEHQGSLISRRQALWPAAGTGRHEAG